MKTIKLFTALALTAILSSPLLSAEIAKNSKYFRDNITVSTSSNSIVVKLGNVKKEVIEIKVLDENNNTLLSEKVTNTSNFIKKYNVSRLVDGNYTLVITKTTIKTVQPFTIDLGELKMSNISKKEELIPVFTFKNNKLNINALLNEYGTISVKLYDNEGHQLFNKKYDKTLTLHQQYDLSKLSNGFYFLEVNAGGEFYNYNIVK